MLWILRRHRTPRQISAVAGRRTASDHGRLFTGCDPLFRHGISTHTGSMPGVSPQGEDTGGNSGNLYVVCGGIFCRYAGIGDPQVHFPGSGEEGYPAQPAGKICPQRCNGEGSNRTCRQYHRKNRLGQGSDYRVESQGTLLYDE